MFKLNEHYELDRKNLKCDYIRSSPAGTSRINTPTSQNNINIPREDSVISLLNSHFDINFEVIKKTNISRYANGDDIRLVNLGPLALFSDFKLTTSSGKHSEDISQTHIVSLMYKLLGSAKDSEVLPFGSVGDRNRKRNE